MATAAVDSPDELLTIEEAAAWAGMSVHGVRAAIRKGKLPRIKRSPGEYRVYIRLTDLERYVPRTRLIPGREGLDRIRQSRGYPVSGLPPAVNAQELQIKSQLFGNIAREARMSMQPLANMDQVAAALSTMLHTAVTLFIATVGKERIDRIARDGRITPEDIAALITAAHQTLERINAQPLTEADKAAWSSMAQIMGDYARTSGYLGVDASNNVGA